MKLFRHVCEAVWQGWHTCGHDLEIFYMLRNSRGIWDARQMFFFLNVFMLGDMRTTFHKWTLAIKEAHKPSRPLKVRDSQTCRNLQSSWQTENFVRFCMLHLYLFRPLSHFKSKKIRLKSPFMISCFTLTRSYHTLEPRHKFFHLSSVKFLVIQVPEAAGISSWLHKFLAYFFLSDHLINHKSEALQNLLFCCRSARLEANICTKAKSSCFFFFL